jgi:hypothetical protein
VIATRARAMTLLGTAFTLGLVVGAVALGMLARGGRAGWLWYGKARQPVSAGYGATLARRLHADLDIGKRDSISVLWCHSEAAMDSIRQPIRGPSDSLFAVIRPRVDSLYQSIRPAVETRRAETRTEIRALLTAPQQQRYDSLNRAEDDQRKKGTPSPNGGSCNGSPGGPGPRGGFDRGPH